MQAITIPQSPSMQMTQRRSTRSHPKAPVQPDPEEAFDLNVSDGDDNDSDAGAARPAPTNLDASHINVGINNADIREGRKLAPDIHYFFDVTPANKVCKECR
jgi:hypothetical protein